MAKLDALIRATSAAVIMRGSLDCGCVVVVPMALTFTSHRIGKATTSPSSHMGITYCLNWKDHRRKVEKLERLMIDRAKDLFASLSKGEEV